MLIPVLPTRESTAAIRDYVSGGGRDVELALGPHVLPGVTLERAFARKPYGVRVRGSALLAARAATQRASILSRDVTPAFTFTGEVDWAGALVRGAFTLDADLTKARWATIAQNDLMHLAVMLFSPGRG